MAAQACNMSVAGGGEQRAPPAAAPLYVIFLPVISVLDMFVSRYHSTGIIADWSQLPSSGHQRSKYKYINYVRTV